MEAPMVKTEAPRNDDVINISTDEEEARCEWGLASCLLFFFLLVVHVNLLRPPHLVCTND